MGEAKRILVVEDDPHARQTVADYLVAKGFSVTTAVDGIEALESLTNGAPDAVILDAHMPRMDGFDFLKEVRLRPEWRGVPVIMVTAVHNDTEHHLRALRYTVADYLAKPVDFGYLLDRVTALTDRPVAPARGDPRYPAEHVVGIGCASWDDFLQLHTRNISHGGIFIETASPLPVHSPIRVKINLPGGREELNLLASVAYVVSPESSPKRNLRPGMGIRFMEPTPDTDRTIDALVEIARKSSVPAARADSDAAPRSASAPAPQEEPAVDPREAAMLETLESEIARLRECNLFERLGLPHTATRRQIRSAFLALSKKFHPDRFYRYRLPEIRDRAQEVYLLLGEAKQELGSEKKREAHRNSCAEQIRASKTSNRASAVSDSDRPGRDSDSGSVKKRKRESGKPATGKATGKATATAKDLAAKKALVEREKLSGMASRLSAEVKTYERGLEALQAGRFRDARKDLAQAVKLAPNATDYKTALYLARGYELKGQGKTAEAMASFQKACDVDAECIPAINELRAHGEGKNRGVRSILRKFFQSREA